MTKRFLSPLNQNELQTLREATENSSSIDDRITELKLEIERRKNSHPQLAETELSIKVFEDILKDLYDVKYIGAPAHKQQLSLFSSDSPIEENEPKWPKN